MNIFYDQSYYRELWDYFDEVEDAVLIAMDTMERTRSVIKNTNGRERMYIESRGEIGYGFLDLLRFFLNHMPFVRSARPERKGKTL